VSSLCRGHANLLCIVPIFSYVTPKGTLVLTAFSGDRDRVLYFGQSAGMLGNTLYVSGTPKTSRVRILDCVQVANAYIGWLHPIRIMIHYPCQHPTVSGYIHQTSDPQPIEHIFTQKFELVSLSKPQGLRACPDDTISERAPNGY